MFLRAISLFVAVVLSAADPIEDPFDAIKIKAFEPGHEDNSGNTLVMRCSIDIDRTHFVNLTKLKFYSSDLSDGINFDSLGSLTKDKLTYGLTRKDISVSGKYQDGSDYRSKLEITWVSPDSGYCKSYKCVATGRDPINGKLLDIHKTFQVDAADGSGC